MTKHQAIEAALKEFWFDKLSTEAIFERVAQHVTHTGIPATLEDMMDVFESLPDVIETETETQ